MALKASTHNVADILREASLLSEKLPTPHLAVKPRLGRLGQTGRRNAGMGEQFWQYRNFMPEDDARKIDWRRSARADDGLSQNQNLFIRESEDETARIIRLWRDPSLAFCHANNRQGFTKSEKAEILLAALAQKWALSGEACGIIGKKRLRSGRNILGMMVQQLRAIAQEEIFEVTNRPNITILASDFFDDLELWEKRLAVQTHRMKRGLLICIRDRLEISFEFKGRHKFYLEGLSDEALVGKAETLKDAYNDKLAQHDNGLKKLAQRYGFELYHIITDENLLEHAASILHLLAHEPSSQKVAYA